MDETTRIKVKIFVEKALQWTNSLECTCWPDVTCPSCEMHEKMVKLAKEIDAELELGIGY